MRHNVIGALCGDYWDDYPSGIGGASYRKHLQMLFETLHLNGALLRFRGSMPDDDLALLLSGSDLCIHPSLTADENYGYVPVEGRACGTPVVATNMTGELRTML